MAMKRIAAMLLTLVLLLSCVGCAQDGRKEPGAEKADLGLTADVKPATDFTAKANAAVYDELDFAAMSLGSLQKYSTGCRVSSSRYRPMKPTLAAGSRVSIPSS